MEYASPIWAQASGTLLEKLESVQPRATKIITGTAPSAKNLKVIQECDLEFLRKRRQFNVIPFTKAKSRAPEHIARPLKTIYIEWQHNTEMVISCAI